MITEKIKNVSCKKIYIKDKQIKYVHWQNKHKGEEKKRKWRRIIMKTKLSRHIRNMYIIIIRSLFGSVNGRSMNRYYGTSKSSTIWLQTGNKLKEKSRDLNRNSSRFFFKYKMKQCSVADTKTVRSLEF